MKTDFTVRNCPPSFQFQCPKKWDELATTLDPKVRSCGQCQELVHLCMTDSETIAHAKAGHCIAREIPDGSELPKMYLGRPTQTAEPTAEQIQAQNWTMRERGIDDSIKNIDAVRSCPECGYPAPHWRVECRVCGFPFGRLQVNSPA